MKVKAFLLLRRVLNSAYSGEVPIYAEPDDLKSGNNAVALLEDGTIIRTSRIISVTKNERHVEVHTKNSTYSCDM